MTDGGVDRSVECTGNVNAMISAFECVHDVTPKMNSDLQNLLLLRLDMRHGFTCTYPSPCHLFRDGV